MALLFGSCGATVNVVLNIILIPRFSYMGSAFVTFVTEICVLIPAICLIQKVSGYHARWWIILQVAVPAVASTLVISRTGLQGSFVGAVVILLLYLVGCLLSGALRINEINVLLKSVRGAA